MDRWQQDGRQGGGSNTYESTIPGTVSTIADAEALGVSLAWEASDAVALDSRGVIERILGLIHQQPRSWIEERLTRQIIERPRTLRWVKGHERVEVIEQADNRAKQEVWVGERMHWPDIVTPAGIRQAYPLHTRAPGHLSWPQQALRGLTYLEADKGPQRQWLREIGKTGDASCVCDGWTPQNAAHLYACLWVGGEVGRSKEQARKDAEWYAAVARFVA